MASDARHLNRDELEAGLDEIRRSPGDEGTLDLIVCRPKVGERRVLAEAQLNLTDGLVGDSWKDRKHWRTGGPPDPLTQLTLMNSRLAALVAQDESRWGLAGDQLFVDLDLSGVNLPAGTRLAIGHAIVEITSEPHTGCRKFVARFGQQAMEFVNSPVGRSLNLRGVNASVVHAGAVRVGDRVRKLTIGTKTAD